MGWLNSGEGRVHAPSEGLYPYSNMTEAEKKACRARWRVDGVRMNVNSGEKLLAAARSPEGVSDFFPLYLLLSQYKSYDVWDTKAAAAAEAKALVAEGGAAVVAAVEAVLVKIRAALVSAEAEYALAVEEVEAEAEAKRIAEEAAAAAAEKARAEAEAKAAEAARLAEEKAAAASAAAEAERLAAEEAQAAYRRSPDYLREQIKALPLTSKVRRALSAEAPRLVGKQGVVHVGGHDFCLSPEGIITLVG